MTTLGQGARDRAGAAVDAAQFEFLDDAPPGLTELQALRTLITRLIPGRPGRYRFWQRNPSPADAFAAVERARPELDQVIFGLRRSLDQLRRRKGALTHAATEVDQAAAELNQVRDTLERVQARVGPGNDEAHAAIRSALAALTPDLAVCHQSSLALHNLAVTDATLLDRVSTVLETTVMAVQTLAVPSVSATPADLERLGSTLRDLQSRIPNGPGGIT